MSDGERVALYLMGQCLCAPENSILIIDEPEIHLHKAILAPLWDALEAKRPNCKFIYITHDLEFAASRTTAKKLWIKEYNGKTWKWDEIPSIDALPDEVVFRILGSRKPILFVEGEESSLDAPLYRACYPDFTVISCGSAGKVIEATKTLNATPTLHRWQAYGLIDRDFHSQEKLEANKAHNVFAIEVAEIENLYCTPEMIEVQAKWWNYDTDELLKKAEDRVFAYLQSQIEEQALKRTEARLEYLITAKLSGGRKNIQEITDALDQLPKQLDASSIYQEALNDYNTVLTNKSYIDALKIYNNKGLLGEMIVPLFSEQKLSRKAYIANVEAILRQEQETGNRLRQALNKYLPNLPIALFP